jgi:hypothetical protein
VILFLEIKEQENVQAMGEKQAHLHQKAEE